MQQKADTTINSNKLTITKRKEFKIIGICSIIFNAFMFKLFFSQFLTNYIDKPYSRNASNKALNLFNKNTELLFNYDLTLSMLFLTFFLLTCWGVYNNKKSITFIVLGVSISTMLFHV